ncbi:hypothetical protein ACFE04_010000 [Oxalis oulophora]
MGVVSISSSAARTPIGVSAKFSTQRSVVKKPLIVAFKGDKPEKTVLVVQKDRRPGHVKTQKVQKKRVGSTSSSKAAAEVDYSEAAAKLESLFKLSPELDSCDQVESITGTRKRGRPKGRKNSKNDEKRENSMIRTTVIRSRTKRVKRLGLDERIALRNNKEEEKVVVRKNKVTIENEKIDRLVRGYSSSTDLVSLDWKKMKIPSVLPASEHTWLFKLMQPMKALNKVKEELQKLGKEPTNIELSKATKLTIFEVKRQIEVGRAARNKLIKHNLRLVLFSLNKYFSDFTNGPKFQDLCQAGVKGLITAIDRFEPKRKLRLSTYGLFWIRHAIIRSMTVSNFTRVPFGLESVRVDIQRAKLELQFELKRIPTEKEVCERVGISPERYQDVMRAAKPVSSLHSKHTVTQEELITGLTDDDGAGYDHNRRQPAIIRLALDDVLDSLKPKESLVIRQRYGLDGKGDRTLGEIAGNLNISREMVRKHEVKAFLKLKHPTRVDYLRQHVV